MIIRKPLYIAIVSVCFTLPLNLSAQQASSSAPNYRAADVPGGDAGRYYQSGAAGDLDNIAPSSFSQRFSVGIRPRVGISNSCGNLNFYQNIEAELKNLQYKLKNTIKNAQAALMTSVSGAISSFMQYQLMKINPTLGQLTTKQLDEYIELFNINVRSCRDYEKDVANGKNPLGEIIQIAVGEQWKLGIGMHMEGKASLEEIEDEIMEEARKNGVIMPDGKSYGGNGQEAINMVKSLVVAGMNLSLARTDKDAWNKDFTINDNTLRQHPILTEFPNADSLYRFAEDIYGALETRIGSDLANQEEVIKSVPGRGYEVKYTEYRDEFLKDLKSYESRTLTREEFERKTRHIIPPVEMDELRRLPPYQKAVELESRAQQYAINRMRNNLIYLKQAIKTGMYAPDLQLSGMKGPMEESYKVLYYRILDDIREIGQRAYQF